MVVVNIQTGDILIVPFTDIGWSPYFPLISGLVTEIGGLISHGKLFLIVLTFYRVANKVTCIKNGNELYLL